MQEGDVSHARECAELVSDYRLQLKTVEVNQHLLLEEQK